MELKDFLKRTLELKNEADKLVGVEMKKAKAGMSKGEYQRLMTGLKYNPSLKMVKDMAKDLNVNLDGFKF